MTRWTMALVVPFVALMGCVHTSTTLLSPTPRPAVDPSVVVLYTTADKVPGKYEEVALIDAHGDDNMVSEHKLYESVRKAAAKAGANGVILQAESEPSTGAKVAHALLWTSADRKGKALAIFVYPNSGPVTVDSIAPTSPPSSH